MLFTSTPLCLTRTCPSWPLEQKGKKYIRWLYLQSFVFSPVLQHRPQVQCAWKVVCGAISGSANLLYDRIVDKCHEKRVVVHCTSRCDMAFDIVQRRRVPCLDNYIEILISCCACYITVFWSICMGHIFFRTPFAMLRRYLSHKDNGRQLIGGTLLLPLSSTLSCQNAICRTRKQQWGKRPLYGRPSFKSVKNKNS